MADSAALSDAPGGSPDSLQAYFERAGLQVDGVCETLSRHVLEWRHAAAMLEDLTPQEADILGKLMPRVRARAGQVLIREGEVGDWMLLLLAGTVDVVKTAQGGSVSRLAVIKQGAAVGEMSMLDSAPRYATCVAIDEVQAGVLTRSVIARLIQEHPAIGAKLLVKLTQLLAQRLRNTSNQLVKLLQQQALAGARS
ncbi:MAG: cyclic nucleotide-binding domain-containing protein [Rhodoferax sp.]|jgi:CRP-like cAMP-binding protein|nr:cyclic nucleotide-binding domain-containing protein [Rhodoferax sp.]